MTDYVDSESQRVMLGNFDHMEDEDVEGIKVNNREYAIYRCKGKFYVTDGRCTHKGALLSEGVVIDDIIECPLHQGRFHIPSGRIAGGPVYKDLKCYETDHIDGIIFVLIQ